MFHSERLTLPHPPVMGPLPRGRYTVEVQAPGHPSLAVGEQEVEPGEERDLGAHYLKPPLR